MAKIKNYLGRNLKSKSKRDKLTKSARSLLMSKIHSKQTSFERYFFEIIKKELPRFETHPKGILGRPDIIIRKHKICVFLDSNFWHGWQYPRWKHKLKNDFWRNKIEKNRKRDKRITVTLRRKGYIVIRLWEHQIKNDPSKCVEKIKNNLANE